MVIMRIATIFWDIIGALFLKMLKENDIERAYDYKRC